MTERTPEQIIGKDALIQLVFEGYEVVPFRCTCQRAGVTPCVQFPNCRRAVGETESKT